MESFVSLFVINSYYYTTIAQISHISSLCTIKYQLNIQFDKYLCLVKKILFLFYKKNIAIEDKSNNIYTVILIRTE